MKTDYMYQVYLGTIGDMKNLEHHFTLMAEQGWMIDKIGLYTHRYRAVEPCKKRFFVDFLPQITMFDYPENESAQDYRRICEESGWRFLAANKQFHVFCTDSENDAPIAIHTDDGIQSKIYLKAIKKYELPWLLCSVFIFWLYSPLGKGVELFLSNISLFMTIGYLFFLIGYIWTLGFTIRWYLRVRKSAKNSLPVPTVNRRLAKLRHKTFAVGVIAFLVCMIIGVVLEVIGGASAVFLLVLFIPLSAFFVGLWIRRQIDTKRRTRGENIGLAIATTIIAEIVLLGGTVFASMNIPFTFNSDKLNGRPALTLNDVGIMAEPSYFSTRVKSTAAVPVNYEYCELGTGATVITQVYRSVNKTLSRWLYDHLAEEFTEQFSRRLNDAGYLQESLIILCSDEAAFWGAEKGLLFNYANSNAVEVLLLNEKTILRITAESLDMDYDSAIQAVRGLWNE